MSVLGLITDTHKRTWQRRSLNVLSGVLTVAAEDNISPIGWTVEDELTLYGRVPARTDAARDLFAAWCRLLGAETQREYTLPDGTVRLHGEARWYRDRVTVVILCEISPPLEDER